MYKQNDAIEQFFLPSRSMYCAVGVYLYSKNFLTWDTYVNKA